uniref:Aminotransferase class I/classII large domain-containing protein n=1 Tax=Tetradesmus obliquus TaxID=3088 RepID=A0A383W6B0_TETOB
MFFEAQSDLWSPDNPDGYIALAVAENRLTTELVQQGLQAHGGFPAAMLYYQDMRGIPELRQAIAGMLQDSFMQGVQIDPQHLSVLAGVGAVLDLLFQCIAEPGDGVLIPAPYYPAFDNDLRVRNQVTTLPVHLDSQQQDFAAALDAAAEAAAAAGHPVSALMFTHPSNPQGTLFSRQQLASMMQWCLRRKVHCISDEVYANSVFDESQQFVSAAHLLQQEVRSMEGSQHAGELVHIVFGFSKDFCASGLRVGCLLTKNTGLNKALDNISYFNSTPCPLQWSLSQLLSDKQWLQHYLQENRRRLREAYASVTSGLDAAGIPYTAAPAGMFLWVDLRAAFGGQPGSWEDEAALWRCMAQQHRVVLTPGGSSSSSSSSSGSSSSRSSSSSTPTAFGGQPGSWEDEAALWRCMAQQHRVVLTPGAACHAAEPGWFRVCYAWTSPGSLPAAVSRIAAAVKQMQGSAS